MELGTSQQEMDGCQNYPFLGTLNIRGRIIIGIQKGTIILTTTQMIFSKFGALGAYSSHAGMLSKTLVQTIWHAPKGTQHSSFRLHNVQQ